MRLLALGTGAIVLLSSRLAFASPDLVLSQDKKELSGEHRFRFVTLTSGARLVVPRKDANNPGFLRIIAHRIQIDAESAIVASGSGDPGRDNDVGQGTGAGIGAHTSKGPGGGGGHGGKGGPGVSLIQCVPDDAAKGGDSFVSDGEELGSSGSAALDGIPSRGGNGGGAIHLIAGKIELNGALISNGEDGYPSSAPAGGGAGGTIRIDAHLFITYGSSATLTANGGKGGRNNDFEGGGGGGGIIYLFATQPPLLALSLVGGSGSCAQASGADGIKSLNLAPGCPDQDKDGILSDQCDDGPSGTDCDDTDESVRPTAEEKCNNVDDNCNGFVDDGADSDCGPDQKCVGGVCVGGDSGIPEGGPITDAGQETAPIADSAPQSDGGVVEGGVVDGAPAPGAQDNDFTLRGGCSQSSRSSRHDAPSLWCAALLALASLKRRARH